MAHWVREFVPTTTVWWWDDSPIPQPDSAQRIVERSDGRNDPIIGDIRHVNAYLQWRIPPELRRYVIDSDNWFSSLSEDQRLKVAAMQVRLGRGLCIDTHRFGGEPDVPASSISDGKVVLSRTLWDSLPLELRRNVILSELPLWDDNTTYSLSPDTPQHIREVANCFVLQEGINCLAVTAYAISRAPEHLNQWLFPDSFHKILNEFGYREHSAAEPRAGDVILFRDGDGNTVHAGYVLAEDRILNKSGQSWFNPIAIKTHKQLLEDWSAFKPAILRSEN